MTQTHYLTEYAMQLAIAEIEQKGGLEMIPRSTTCSVATNECWPLLPHTFGAAEPAPGAAHGRPAGDAWEPWSRRRPVDRQGGDH